MCERGQEFKVAEEMNLLHELMIEYERSFRQLSLEEKLEKLDDKVLKNLQYMPVLQKLSHETALGHLWFTLENTPRFAKEVVKKNYFTFPQFPVHIQQIVFTSVNKTVQTRIISMLEDRLYNQTEIQDKKREELEREEAKRVECQLDLDRVKRFKSENNL